MSGTVKNRFALTASDGDYNVGARLLSEIAGAETAAEAASDAKITSDEILIALDDNCDGRLRTEDFASRAFLNRASLFADCEDLFSRHGVTLVDELADLKAAVARFAKTGEAPAALRNSGIFLSRAVEIDSRAIRFLRDATEQMNCRFAVRKSLKADPANLLYVLDEVQFSLPDVVLSALERDGLVLEYTSPDFQTAFPGHVIVALVRNPEALAFVSPAFQVEYPGAVEAALAVLGEDGAAFVSDEFAAAFPWAAAPAEFSFTDEADFAAAGRDAWLAGVAQDPSLLKLVPESAQVDFPEIVWAALMRDPDALADTAPRFQTVNDELVRSTIDIIGHDALLYLTPEFQLHPSQKDYVAGLIYDDAGEFRRLAREYARLYPEDYADLADYALSQDGLLLECVDASFQIRNPKSVIKAVEENPLALEFVASGFRSAHPQTHDALALGAIEREPRTLAFVSRDFLERHEKEVFNAVVKDPAATALLPEDYLATRPDAVELAIAGNGLVLGHVPERIKAGFADRDVVEVLAVRSEPGALEFVSAGFFENHVDLVRESLTREPSVIRFLPESFQANHPDFAFLAVRMDGAALAGVAGSVFIAYPKLYFEAASNDEKIFTRWDVDKILGLVDFSRMGLPVRDKVDLYAEAVLENVHAFAYVPEAERTRVWARVRERLAEEGLRFPERDAASFESFQAYLGARTEYPKRFRAMRVIHHIFAEEDLGVTDARPTVLLLYNKADASGAFNQSHQIFEELVDSGDFRVVYREIGSDDEFFASLEAAAPVHTLVVGGHGTAQALQLGFEAEDVSDEDARLDREDFTECDDSRLILPGGQILLDSCDTGHGGAGADNLRESFAEMFPGRDVIAFEDPVGYIFLRVNDDLSIDVDAYSNSGNVRVVRSRPEP